MNKFKKIAKIVADVLIVIIFIMSVVVIIAGAQQRKSGVAGAFGYSISIVQTDSMSGTFEIGDIAIGKMIGTETVISEGDIIMFKTIIDSKLTTNTHRVMKVHTIGAEEMYETKGDNTEGYDEGYRTRNDVVSVYKFRIPGLGKVIQFIKTAPGFIICLVIPLAIFILYEAFALVKLYMDKRKEDMIESAQNATSDDVKDAIIKEYLEKQRKEAEAAAEAEAKSKSADTSEENEENEENEESANNNTENDQN